MADGRPGILAADASRCRLRRRRRRADPRATSTLKFERGPRTRDPWPERRRQERADADLSRPAGAVARASRMGEPRASRRAASPGDGVPARRWCCDDRRSATSPSRWRRGCSGAGARAAARTRARAGRARRPRAAAGARAVGRRAAAPGAGTRVATRARGAVPRRTDGEPRPRCHARDRVDHPVDPRRRNQDRDDHAQPRPGPAPRRRDRLCRPRSTLASVRRPTLFFRTPATPEADAFLEGELPWH